MLNVLLIRNIFSTPIAGTTQCFFLSPLLVYAWNIPQSSSPNTVLALQLILQFGACIKTYTQPPNICRSIFSNTTSNGKLQLILQNPKLLFLHTRPSFLSEYFEPIQQTKRFESTYIKHWCFLLKIKCLPCSIIHGTIETTLNHHSNRSTTHPPIIRTQ